MTIANSRVLSLSSLRWVIRHRAWSPWHLARYWRFAVLRVRHPEVVTTGMVFLDRGVEIGARRGLGRIVLGRWVHVGAGTALRCHEGTLTVGDKTVLGRDVSVNCYLDVEIGDSVLIADDVYISDFDHRFEDVTVAIKDQGIVQSRVRIGRDVWIGTKVTVTRGVTIGRGAVIGANAVVSRDVPDEVVAVGAPARVVKRRGGGGDPAAERAAWPRAGRRPDRPPVGRRPDYPCA